MKQAPAPCNHQNIVGLEISGYRILNSRFLLDDVNGGKPFFKNGNFKQDRYSYVTDALGLRETMAYCFIRVARKAHEVPELKLEVFQRAQDPEGSPGDKEYLLGFEIRLIFRMKDGAPIRMKMVHAVLPDAISIFITSMKWPKVEVTICGTSPHSAVGTIGPITFKRLRADWGGFEGEFTGQSQNTNPTLPKNQTPYIPRELSFPHGTFFKTEGI